MAKKPRYQEIDRFTLPPTLDPDTFRGCRSFLPRKEDVVVATYPKCGTTWMQQIVLLILRNGEPILTFEEYFTSMAFLEMTTLQKLETMQRPLIIKTHLPCDLVKFSKEAKYIYVARHPEDCVVSFYHHTRFFPIYFFCDGTFDDLFHLFVRGEVDWGDYFDHLLSWYEKKDEPNILFLTYESMSSDPRGVILKVAQFLGEEYHERVVAEDGKLLEKILRYSSLDFMRSTVNDFRKAEFSKVLSPEVQVGNPTMARYADLLREASGSGHESVGEFIRRGIVGEGKITLTQGQKMELERRIREKTSQSDVMNLWKSI